MFSHIGNDYTSPSRSYLRIPMAAGIIQFYYRTPIFPRGGGEGSILIAYFSLGTIVVLLHLVLSFEGVRVCFAF